MPVDLTSSTIDLRITDISQLFNNMDPFPFRERDLAKDVEEYLYDHAEEMRRDLPIQVVVHLPGEAMQTDASHSMPAAFTNFFQHRHDSVSRELSDLFRIGRLSLMIGLAVLAVCMILGQILSRILPHAYFADFLEEGLIILGWVANWRPLEIFLYEWWPIKRKQRIYRQLAESTLVLKAR